MRRSRGMTEGERWELGLFLIMLFVGCLTLAAILNLNGLPTMAAQASNDKALTTQTQLESDKPVLAAPPAPAVLPMAPAPIAPQPAATILQKPAVKKVAAEDVKFYKGEKYRYVRTLRLRVTAYAPDARCCYPYPGTTTATGLSVKTNSGHLVAADPRLIPMHSLVVVPGYDNGAAVPVLDTGGAIKGHRLDVLLPSFSTAKDWGSRMLDVKIYEPVD